MFTLTASVGQSVSQGMQYQHSSYFMCALPVSGLIHRTSSGQTSMQTRQPFSAMHFSSSTMTGTAERWLATGMVYLLGSSRAGTVSPLFCRGEFIRPSASGVGRLNSPLQGETAAKRSGIGGLFHQQLAVSILLFTERDDVVGDRALAVGHLAIGVLEQAAVVEPFSVVLLGEIDPVVVQPPA